MDRENEFYVLAVVIGLVQGGVQSLSRSFYAKMIPAESSARFFGFYDMLGKFAAVIGPFLMGLVSVLSGNPRYSIVAVIFLFVSGAGFLYFAKETRYVTGSGSLRRCSAILTGCSLIPRGCFLPGCSLTGCFASASAIAVAGYGLEGLKQSCHASRVTDYVTAGRVGGQVMPETLCRDVPGEREEVCGSSCTAA